MTRRRNASALPGVLPPSLLPPLGSWRRRTGPDEPVWREHTEALFVANIGSFRAPNVTRVKLSDGTTLSNPTRDDQRRIVRLRERALFSLTAWSTPKLGKHVAKTRVTSRDYETAEEEARQRLHRLHLALRLIKPGAVTLSGEMAYQPRVTFSVRRFTSWFPGGPLFAARTRDYEFDAADRPLFRRLYDGLAAVMVQADIALRRFDMANERETPEDRVVDYWVALESLFSRRGETELRYRFAMRIAYFMEEQSDRRLDLFNRLYDAYQVRSDILHGGVSKRDVAQAEEVSAEALRASLRSLVVEGKRPDPDELDHLAAKGMSRSSVP